MKKRTILPIAGLVVLSGIAAISGTFAWFQTNRSATIAFDDAVVQSRDSALKVELKSSLNTLHDGVISQQDAIDAINAASYSEFGDVKLSIAKADTEITDISGDGTDFYKVEHGSRPNDNDAKIDGMSWQVAEDIYEVELVDTGDADGYLIDFTLELSRDELTTGEGRALDVYLGEGTAIHPVTVGLLADETAVAGARMSLKAGAYSQLFTQIEEEAEFEVWSGYDAAGDPTYIMDGGNRKKFANDPLYSYLEEDVAGEAYQLAGYQIVDAGALDDLESHVDGANIKIGQIAGINDKLELNVRVWVEGTDADIGINNPNVAVGGKIRVVLDLFTKHVN